MPRPRKCRKVCCLPQSNLFGPLHGAYNGTEAVLMSVDEYETIRLIDYESMSQEECADSMDVARTTIQGIYSSARKKIATSIVEGKTIKIEGGDYRLFDEDERMRGNGRCRRHGGL